jgi:hypothetical protein
MFIRPVGPPSAFCLSSPATRDERPATFATLFNSQFPNPAPLYPAIPISKGHIHGYFPSRLCHLRVRYPGHRFSGFSFLSYLVGNELVFIVVWIGQGPRSGSLSKGPGLRRNIGSFREGPDPEDNPAAPAAPGRSLRVLCASVVNMYPVIPVNSV